ncbi:MAG: HlyD family efflux transporter periplasmic adaptor subunit [Clostridiales bacterium]|nr:HlyD family efflux transporter periplasmic adaptor subunit [Clostridiales bacterium]
MSKRAKILIVSIAAAAAIGGVVWVAFRPPTIECMALTLNTLENSFSEIGEIIPISEYDIYTKTGGKLLKINAEEGALVKSGEQLFLFDDNDARDEEDRIIAEIAVVDSQIREQISALETQRRSLESDREGLRIELELAQIEEGKLLRDLESYRALFEIGGISAQELQNMESAYELLVKQREQIDSRMAFAAAQAPTVSAQIQNLRHAQSSGSGSEGPPVEISQPLSAQKALLETTLEILRKNRSEKEVYAARDGVVQGLSVKADQILAPGAKLCSIYQPGEYRIDCYILVENVSGVHIGDDVTVTVRLRDEDRRYKGTISWLGHAAADITSKAGVAEKRVKTEISVHGDEWEYAGPHWPVEVRFTAARSKDCIIAPKTALFESGSGEWMVWAVRDGIPEAVAVEKGVETPSQVEIKGEISPGEVIVVNAKTANITSGKQIKAAIDGGRHGN